MGQHAVTSVVASVVILFTKVAATARDTCANRHNLLALTSWDWDSPPPASYVKHVYV